MNQLKPVITVRLLPRLELVTWSRDLRFERKDGPDTWNVKLTITSPEGHITQHHFTDASKAVALGKAYAWLNKHMIHQWFPKFYAEQYALNEELFSVDGMERKFNMHMTAVEAGQMTRARFIERWANREEIVGVTQKPIMSRVFDEPFVKLVVPEPPPKWRFRDWFK